MFRIILAIGLVGSVLIALGIVMFFKYGSVYVDGDKWTEESANAFASLVGGFAYVFAGILMVVMCLCSTKFYHKEYEYFDKCFDYSGTVEYKENDEVVIVKIPLKPDAKLEYNAEEGCFYYTP
jgi:hypothetical protein